MQQEIRPRKTNILAQEWINKKCNNSNYSLSNNLIKCVSKKCCIFGTTLINQKNNSFSIKIERLSKQIGIGIIDCRYVEQKQYVAKNAPNLIYYCNTRRYKKYCQDSHEGEGFNEGDTVKVIINLRKSKIQWRVQNKTVCLLKSTILEQNTIPWVPYIEMSEGSIVRIRQ